MRYFARISAGLEQLGWREVGRLDGAQLLGTGHRRIDFTYAGPPAGLLGLRAADDVYAYVARLNGLDHTRASLARITRRIAALDFTPALDAIAAVRALPEYPSYRVTASHLGRRNYSRYDVEGAVEQALTPRQPWRFLLNDAGEPEPDLDLRVLLEADWALVGLRLAAAPLHRRAYWLGGRSGSLKPPVAAAMLLLAAPPPGGTLLDLACGAGTIVAEAWAYDPSLLVVGGDTDTDALLLAQKNLAALGAPTRMAEAVAESNPSCATPEPVAGSAAIDPAAADCRLPTEAPRVWLYQGDARTTPLPAASVAAVVSNLPWGAQVPVADDPATLYSAILAEVARVLAPGGRAVLLTDQAAAMQAALAATPGLALAETLPISLYGKHPVIYSVVRSE